MFGSIDDKHRLIMMLAQDCVQVTLAPDSGYPDDWMHVQKGPV